MSKVTRKNSAKEPKVEKDKNTGKRKKLKINVARKVALTCRRVCAMCWALYGVGSAQRGQIAHADHDPTNDKENNLVWLCVSCHDEYDSTPKQTRRIDQGELKAYKSLTESDVKNGKIPRIGSSGTAAIDLAVKGTRLNPSERENLQVWLQVANTGDRPTGFRSVELVHPKWNFEFMTDVEREFGEFHSDSERLYLASDQIVEAGQLRWWVCTFRGSENEKLSATGKNGLVKPEDPFLLRFNPVVGPSAAIEIEQLSLYLPSFCTGVIASGSERWVDHLPARPSDAWTGRRRSWRGFSAP